MSKRYVDAKDIFLRLNAPQLHVSAPSRELKPGPPRCGEVESERWCGAKSKLSLV